MKLDIEWPEISSSEDSSLIILDEAQAAPEIFPKIRGAVDNFPQAKGRFLLLGSVSPALMKQVSESLAGRLALLELTPFTFNEIGPEKINQVWNLGGFPEGGVLNEKRYPEWQSNYLSLLIQRDLPDWGLSAKPQTTERFLKMLAQSHGQLWNASQIGKSLGLSYHTVNDYLDYLIGAFLIRRLAPYFTNIKKRITKSPKIYWKDPGLLHALLNFNSASSLLDYPWVGASWEGFVIEQILATLKQRDISFDPYFFRTATGEEIDLVLESGNRLIAIEIKLSSTPNSDDFKKLNKIADLIKADLRILVSQTPDSHKNAKQISCSLPWLIANINIVC